jgi:putative ABC transport system permease protein
MAIPFIYNVRSVRARWTSAIVAVLGIAGAVGVFVAMLSLARGFRATLVASGSPSNAIVLRGGVGNEMSSIITLADVRVVEDAPGVDRGEGGPRVSPEVVVVAAFPLKKTGTDANVQIRGVSPRVLEIRANAKITQGRMFKAGLNELVAGRNVAGSYAGLDLGNTVKFGGGTWTVVGVFDAGGSAFDSELWCDAAILDQVYQRPPTVFQSMTVRLTSPEAFSAFKDALSADPRLTVDTERETAYYAKTSESLTTMITVLGTLVAFVMGIGAVFGALNTMYSAISERTREIATMRALGFEGGAVVSSFVFESLFIAGLGGLLGCAAILPINGWTTGTINFQTFSHLAFAFKVTPDLLGVGLAFALLMGLVGGLPPAIRAAKRPVAAALREL